jgi:hypothetical protein
MPFGKKFDCYVLKRLKKTLLLPDASEEENKQGIEIHEEDSQTSPKKNRG